ncbi:MAG: GHMP kinase [Pseudomonadota bacterium]
MSTSAITKPSDRRRIRARAPGKLILSGEHSVVYGAPALAVAVEHYTEVWFTPMHRSEGLRTAFDTLSQGAFYPFDALKSFKAGLDSRFDAFLRGELPVQKILKRPDDLAIYTLTSLLPYLPVPGVTATRRLPAPGQLSSSSDLPLGAGMGSSAAVIAATFALYEHLLEVPQSEDDRFKRVRFCERLQHGHGSAIDAASVVYGGVNRVQSDAAARVPLQLGDGWYWVLHGRPDASTGECVAHVRSRYGRDKARWEAFADCTDTLQQVLEVGGDPSSAIRENHRLLSDIDVVPAPAERFVDAVEQCGGSAKISGAGTIRGEYGGVVLIYMPDPEAMETLMRAYPDRRWAPLRVASQGAHLFMPSVSEPAAAAAE